LKQGDFHSNRFSQRRDFARPILKLFSDFNKGVLFPEQISTGNFGTALAMRLQTRYENPKNGIFNSLGSEAFQHK
jgi:hypothetical protein